MMKKLLCSLLFTVLTVGFVNAQADVNLQGNSTDITDGSTTPSLTNHTDFGDVSIGTSFTRTFTIQNTDLGGSSLNLTGPGIAFNFGFDSQFGLDLGSTGTPITNVTPTTFDVTFTATTLGVANAVVNVTTDDPDVAEQSYTFAITANGTAAVADVNLQGNSTDIADGSTTPSITNHTDFGDVGIGSSLTRTFTIQNTGGGDLNLTGPGIAFNFGFDSQFGLDLGGTGSPITNITPTSFDVTFTATTLGVANAVVNVTTDDPDVAEQSYTFAITANGTAAAADVNLQGNSTDIADGSTTPSLTNHTDFGDVGIGSSLTRTFTIQNTGDGDLNLTGPGIAFNFGFDSQFGLDLGGTGSPITNITPTTFDVTFTATTLGVANAVVNVTTDDPDVAEQSYTFAITANGTAAVADVNLQGNSTDIADGSTTPSLTNHTDFGDVGIGSSLTRTFTIQNTGGADLNLTGSGVAFNFGFDPQFGLDLGGTGSPITNITPTTFDVTFTATTLGVANAVVNVTTDDPDVAEQSYTFAITANGITPPSTTPLLITQYYEGSGTNNKWIEVKNISPTGTAPTIAGFYNLAVFLDGNATTTGALNITNNSPNASVGIPALAPGEVALFYRGSTAPAGLGLPDEEVFNTEVCSFTGNDVIVISTSVGTTCYNDRIDVIGVVGSVTTDWGTNMSLVKGCGTTLQPAIEYDPVNIEYDAAQFIQLTLDEVDNADPTMDIALGTQSFGTTTFTTAWSDGLPDKTRDAIVDGAYTNSNGSLSACNLTINSGASIIMDSDGAGNNFVSVTNDFVNNGVFTLGDTESFTITSATGTNTGVLTKIEKSTPLNNFRDLTYWSSPVATTIGSAFVGVDASRIFQWRTPSSGDTGNWELASGSMEEGRGYVSEAPISVTSGLQHQVNFVGVPNNGSVNVTVGADLTNAEGFGGYNIIGNPYPSAIRIEDFLRNQDNDEINNGEDETYRCDCMVLDTWHTNFK